MLFLFYFGCEEGKGEGRRGRIGERGEGGGWWYLRLGEGGKENSEKNKEGEGDPKIKNLMYFSIKKNNHLYIWNA